VHRSECQAFARVLHTLNASSETSAIINAKLHSLIVGGVNSIEEAFQFGGEAVERIGTILNSPETTFIGPAATLNNFSMHISNSDLLHIHLHTNYPTRSASDTIFTTSPLSQAIAFNSPSPHSGEPSAREILALNLSSGCSPQLQ
jgi:hypothetical protein